MPQPKVSFAMICYQQESYVREAILAAFAQEYEPLEIILSDDCSTDSTFSIIEEESVKYSGPHKVITNRNSTNLGIEHLNKVMSLASGDFVIIAHGDDVSLPNRTSRMVETWIDKKVSLVSSNAIIVDSKSQPLGKLSKEDTDREVPLKKVIYITWDNTRLGATFGWDRNVFSQFDAIDGKRIPGADDHILPFRAALLEGIYYLEEPLIQWRKHENNGTDRVADKTGSELMFSETSIAYDVGALIYMAEEFAQFRKGQNDSKQMGLINRDLETAIMELTLRWTRCRVSLDLAGFSPTWIDKQEREKKELNESLRVQPDVPLGKPKIS